MLVFEMSDAMLGVGSLLFRCSTEPETARLDMLRPDLARGVGESSNGLLSIRGSTRQEGVGWLAGEVGWLLGAGVGCWVLDAGVGSETLGC